MSLDKSRKDKILEPSIYQGVKDFYEVKLKYNAGDVQDSEYF